MQITVQKIAEAMQGQVLGNGALVVSGLAEPGSAAASDLALAMAPRYADALKAGQARAAVVWDGADIDDLGLEAAIVVARPRLAMAHLTQMMDQPPTQAEIHSTAVVDPSAKIGTDIYVGPFCVIGADVTIGDGTVLHAHITVQAGVVLGSGCQLHPGVRLGRRVTLGDRCILHPNVVVGADGFSFVTEAPSIAETGRRTLGRTPFEPLENATQHRIHSLGGVVVGDDVEVGANSTIDAGTIRATQVGRGTKIDNLVQVGHNVIIGADCLLCAHAAVAGSAVIGDRTILGGKSGVADNITIGRDCLFGGAAIALGDVPDGSFVMGYPAKTMLKYRAEQRALRDAAARGKGEASS